MSMNYPPSCGYNFHEVLRVADSLVLSRDHDVYTPVNWVRGQDVMVGKDVDELKADKMHENVQRVDLPSKKGYLRVVRDPSASCSVGVWRHLRMSNPSAVACAFVIILKNAPVSHNVRTGTASGPIGKSVSGITLAVSWVVSKPSYR